MSIISCMGLQSKAINGAQWNTLSTGVLTVTQIVKISILTRLLESSDFGLLAIVNLVLGFVTLFSDLGIRVAIIHKQNITEKEYSSLYWLSIIISIILFLILCGLAPLAAIFYKESQLTHLIILMGSVIVISALGNQFSTILAKNLDFKLISCVNIVTSIIGLCTAVILAILHFGIYSMIYSAIVQSLLSSIFFLWAGRKEYRLRFHLSFKEVLDFLRIGGFQTGAQLLDYISNQIDVMLIGHYFQMNELGIYNLAKQLILHPSRLINPIINNVAAPIFSKIQQNASLIKESYLKLLNLLSSINFPIFFLMFIYADPIVRILYGADFMETITFVRILSIFGMISSISNPAGSLQVAKGRTDLGFKWTVFRSMITPLTIVIASLYSIKAVAYSQTIISIFFYFIYWRFMIFTLTGITLKEYIFSVRINFINTIISIIIPTVLLIWSDNVIQLIIGMTVFFLCYVVLSWKNNPEAIMYFDLFFNKKR